MSEDQFEDQTHLVETAHGSGLGLALVEQITVAHRAHFILNTPENHSGVKAVVSL